jgi:hypothetical protein
VYAADKCRAEMPPLLEVGANHHQAACWFPRGEGR